MNEYFYEKNKIDIMNDFDFELKNYINDDANISDNQNIQIR
jgi:hypothetical protein